MTLKEALETGRRIRRAINEHWIFFHPKDRTSYSVQEVLATDWEAESKVITLGADDLRQAANRVRGGHTSPHTLIEKLIKELGLE